MSEPVRILELRSVRGTGGGPEKTILQSAANADRRRFEVVVCYIRDDRDDVYAIDRRAAELGVDYVEVRERHSFDPAIWPALRSLVRQRRIQIVHSHEHKTDLLAWALAAREDVVPLSTAHGWAGDSRRERVYYAVDKRLLARFPCVIAVSSAIKAELVRTGSRAEQIVVIPNGIDHRAFVRDGSQRDRVRAALGLSPGQIVIGAVGRLEAEKRFDLLIEAVAHLRRTRPQIQLLIAGEGRARADLESQISALALAPACRLLGQRADVVALHHAFDLFVQSSDREGTPNVVLEAMALETPIVATDVGGTAELVTDGVHGLIVPRGDAVRLREAIDRVLADPKAALDRVREARRRVETELSFEHRTSRVEAIYDRLARKQQEAAVGLERESA
jgi:glycosyltransferase involved in cell wall biosynthesis